MVWQREDPRNCTFQNLNTTEQAHTLALESAWKDEQSLMLLYCRCVCVSNAPTSTPMSKRLYALQPLLKVGRRSFLCASLYLPDQSEAPRFQQSNTNTTWFFCTRTRLQGCRRLMVMVSMELSAPRTSIKTQPIKIQTTPAPLSRA